MLPVTQCHEAYVLLAREWIPVSETPLAPNAAGPVLPWSGQFNSALLERTLAMGASPVLVNCHGGPRRHSPTTRRTSASSSVRPAG